MEFMPAFAEDGLYELFVEAADATGNKTGDINHVVSLSTFGYDYKISFKVITESMISNVLNYPNPFSTSTRFLYTLTGSEPPAYFTIQIFSVSGRVVREISPQEIGPMKIGTHLTDYAWDGRDEFGDPLANGVYLYRIAAKKANGENFKAFTSGADAYFEKGFGKMVIIR
ncbi:MAG: T9SS type A sorting domain-containing protein [Saprospirales bacterium]|nr:T9SS type A sorting domain-containing protein [Saprospirales bacterium]